MDKAKHILNSINNSFLLTNRQFKKMFGNPWSRFTTKWKRKRFLCKNSPRSYLTVILNQIGNDRMDKAKHILNSINNISIKRKIIIVLWIRPHIKWLKREASENLLYS